MGIILKALQPGTSYRPDEVVAHAGATSVSEVLEAFKSILGVDDSRILKAAWKVAQDTGRFRWKQGEELTGADLQKMKRALQETLVFHGNGIEVEGEGQDQVVHGIVEFLLGRGRVSSKWVTWQNIRGTLLRKDPNLLRAMREELQLALLSCMKQLPEVASPEEARFEAFVGHVIALLPYSYPEQGETFVIPQKVNGKWGAHTYVVDRLIELSPRWFSTPIAAFGLTSESGPPIVTFLGTTFPAGDGFVATLLADFTPGMSVGHAPYLYGKKALEKWLSDKREVRLFGMSLGGSLALHTLRHQQDKIGEVAAFNPAGLYPWDWQEKIKETAVRLYIQENDIVALMGALPEGEKVNVYRVLGERRENSFNAHARVYTGGRKVTLLKSDPAFENSRIKRKFLTVMHLIVGIAFAFFCIFAFYLFYKLCEISIKLCTAHLNKINKSIS